MTASRAMHEPISRLSGRRRQDQEMDVEKRAASLVRQGELSSARMALEGAEVAPGNLATLRELTSKAPVRFELGSGSQ